MRRLKNNTLSERDEQILFIDWLKLHKYRYIVSANGGSRNVIEAKNLKRTGVTSGIPDIFVPHPTKVHHGFFCEMKNRKSGRLSLEQKNWIEYLTGQGYFACVAHGFDEAAELFNFYLKFDS